MAESTPNPLPEEASGRPRAVGGTIMLVAGVILALLGFLPLVGGIAAAAASARMDDGRFMHGSAVSLSAGGYAITSPTLRVDTDLGDLPSQLLTVEARASSTGGGDVFLGVASRDDVDRYLESVAHTVVSNTGYGPHMVRYRDIAGTRAPADPADQSFWAESDVGESAVIRTPVRAGDWVVVVMNRDASQGVDVAADLGARSDVLLPVAVALILVGLVVVVGGAVLVAVGAAAVGRTGAAGRAPADVPRSDTEPFESRTYPARLDGRLSPDVSRALWLVKWILVIPHGVILFFLWIAVAVVSVVAWFAILFTGRYPRALFDFTVGVVRWTWRVAFYGYSALGTDVYPPFTLARTDYPADFDVPYPERLSRGLVLVKSWLLAIPHLVIVSVLVGGASWTVWERGEASRAAAPSLLGVLVLVAAVILLVTAHYQRPLFGLVMGINRWSYRVLVYALLLRDEYPPFRLDQGQGEPGSAEAPLVGHGTFGPTTGSTPGAP